MSLTPSREGGASGRWQLLRSPPWRAGLGAKYIEEWRPSSIVDNPGWNKLDPSFTVFARSLWRAIWGTVASVLTHTCRWTPKSMGYYRVWVLAELVPGPFFVSYTVPFQSIRQAMLHVTCLPKFWIRHMGEMTVTDIFFRQIFTIFFAISKAFFTTSFYGFGTWPKWPLQPLHFGVFGAAVTRYCRIDRNGTVMLYYVFNDYILSKYNDYKVK